MLLLSLWHALATLLQLIVVFQNREVAVWRFRRQLHGW